MKKREWEQKNRLRCLWKGDDLAGERVNDHRLASAEKQPPRNESCGEGSSGTPTEVVR
jgi:hypothetical protein